MSDGAIALGVLAVVGGTVFKAGLSRVMKRFDRRDSLPGENAGLRADLLNVRDLLDRLDSLPEDVAGLRERVASLDQRVTRLEDRLNALE